MAKPNPSAHLHSESLTRPQKDVEFRFRCELQFKERWLRLALRKKKDMSELARSVLEAYCDEQEKLLKPPVASTSTENGDSETETEAKRAAAFALKKMREKKGKRQPR